MMPKIKNIIIFLVIGGAMVFGYITLTKKSPEQPDLVTSSQSVSGDTATTTTEVDNQLSKDFLTVLLSIKNITLDDSIFADVAFMNLKDSTIVLLPDGSEGRPNPFAPIGAENNTVPDVVRSGFDSLNLEEETEVKTETTTKPTTTKKPTTR